LSHLLSIFSIRIRIKIIFFPENNIIHLSLPSISSGQMFHIRLQLIDDKAK